MVFALCGGDVRQSRLAGLLLEDGHGVRSWALEKAELPGGVRACETAAEALEGAGCLLLPMAGVHEKRTFERAAVRGHALSGRSVRRARAGSERLRRYGER